MSEERTELETRKKELENRLNAIRKDIGSGLDKDSEEQAVQLENMEVLQEIARLAEEELQELGLRLAELSNES